MLGTDGFQVKYWYTNVMEANFYGQLFILFFSLPASEENEN